MTNTIKLKRGSGSNPGASDLSVGEVALRTDNGTLFTKNDAGNVTEIGASSGVSDGDKGDITVSSSGSTWTIDSGATQVANKLPLAGGTLTGDLLLTDNSDIKIGTGQDINIWHNGTSSGIDNKTGHLYIRNNYGVDVGGNIYIKSLNGENSNK